MVRTRSANRSKELSKSVNEFQYKQTDWPRLFEFGASLKFEIRDLLIATALIALSLMAYRFYREGNRRTQEIEAAKQDMASKNSEIQINDYYLCLLYTSDAADE